MENGALPGSNAITASITCVHGSTIGSAVSMAGSADIVNGEDWTRPQFLACTTIPVPAVVWF